MSRHRHVRENVTRFAHPGAMRGNCANYQFHLRQAALNTNSLMAHLAGAERDNPGCTGQAFEQLTALMAELQRCGMRGGVSLGIVSTPPRETSVRDGNNQED